MSTSLKSILYQRRLSSMFNEIKFKAEADRFRKLYTDTQRELKMVEEKNVLLETKVKELEEKLKSREVVL